MTELEKQQIEVARYWAGVKEMEGSPYSVEVFNRGSDPTDKGLTFFVSIEPTDRINSDRRTSNEGPYLKIEDGNPWSSAAIFARAVGVGVNLLPSDYIWEYYRADKDTQGFCNQLADIQDAGYLELAYNMVLQWLHKHAPDVWAKGMEGLA